jgi:anti-sigma28 factor (negative regulator of flagellin synthesis)
MHLRSDIDDRSQSDGRGGMRRASGPSSLRSDRVHEIRERIANDAYRSVDVAEEIARRILRSRDL